MSPKELTELIGAICHGDLKGRQKAEIVVQLCRHTAGKEIGNSFLDALLR